MLNSKKVTTGLFVGLSLMTAALTFSYQAQAEIDLQSTLKWTPQQVSDEALIKKLPGFENRYAVVNGVKLHYVIGGDETLPPLVLLPGHPETWWAYHTVMPGLAKYFRVIVVDIRGMGSSDKPQDGYDKKTMATDIYGLIKSLGYQKVNIAGHDIGAMVAFSFAANFPEATTKLALLDVPHPDETWAEMKMLPEEGKVGTHIDPQHPVYPWWFTFHQIDVLPEQLLAGNGMRIYINWLFDYMARDPQRIPPFDLAVYGQAYSNPDAIRSGHAWYKAWPTDIRQQKSYAKVTVPILGLGAEYTGWHWLQIVKNHATNVKLVKVKDSGHFMLMEQPAFVEQQMTQFFRD